MVLVWSAQGSYYFTVLHEEYQGSLHVGACIRAKDLFWSQYFILCGSGLQCNQPETWKITTTKDVHNTQYLISSSPENFKFCMVSALCCLLCQDRRAGSGDILTSWGDREDSLCSCQSNGLPWSHSGKDPCFYIKRVVTV